MFTKCRDKLPKSKLCLTPNTGASLHKELSLNCKLIEAVKIITLLNCSKTEVIQTFMSWETRPFPFEGTLPNCLMRSSLLPSKAPHSSIKMIMNDRFLSTLHEVNLLLNCTKTCLSNKLRTLNRFSNRKKLLMMIMTLSLDSQGCTLMFCHPLIPSYQNLNQSKYEKRKTTTTRTSKRRCLWSTGSLSMEGLWRARLFRKPKSLIRKVLIRKLYKLLARKLILLNTI
jgi:hypothetical protein